MISMLSLLECITSSSLLSIEDIKLIAFVSLIFQVSDLLRLYMMSFKNCKNFKNGLILFRYSSTNSVLFPLPLLSYSIKFNIIVTPKIAHSNWFMIISFFFMLKKILNISKYSIFNCFSFSFFSKQICYIFLCSAV